MSRIELLNHGGHFICCTWNAVGVLVEYRNEWMKEKANERMNQVLCMAPGASGIFRRPGYLRPQGWKWQVLGKCWMTEWMRARRRAHVCSSQKQVRDHKKTVPRWGFYSSSVGPIGAPCLPSLWFNYCFLRSAWQPFCLLSNCSRGWGNKEEGKCLLSRYGNFPKDIFLCERWEEGGKVEDMSFQTCQRHKPTKLCCCFHKCLISFII